MTQPLRQRISVKDFGCRVALSNPLLAALFGSMFAGAKVRRGMPPRPAARYALLKSDAFEEIDENNRRHVESVLKMEARKHQCSVHDLGWALGPAGRNGIRPVLVKKWADIEKAQWEAKRA